MGIGRSDPMLASDPLPTAILPLERARRWTTPVGAEPWAQMAAPKRGDEIMSERHPAARLAADIGGTFTDIVLLDGRAPLRRQGADDAAGAGDGRHRRHARRAGGGGPRLRRHRRVRARHHARHQRHHRAQGRAHRADRHRRLPRRHRDRRREPLRPVRHQHRQAAAAGAARAALHGARAHGRARRRAAARSTKAPCAGSPSACRTSTSRRWPSP